MVLVFVPAIFEGLGEFESIAWSITRGGTGFEFRSGERSGITRPPPVLDLRRDCSGSEGTGV